MLPTPGQSLDKERDELVARVEVAIETMMKSQMEITVNGIRKDDFRFLQNEGAQMIDEWEGLRIDHLDDKLILKYPTWQHNGLVDIISVAVQPLRPWIRLGGSPDIELHYYLGTKSPDMAIVSANTKQHKGYPTVVFETGYSQSLTEFNHNAARFLFGSLGKVYAVVNVIVEMEGGQLSFVEVDVWRIEAEEVGENEVKGIPWETILTDKLQPASSQILDWEFNWVTKVEPESTIFMTAKPKRYQIYPQNELKQETFDEGLPRIELQPEPFVLLHPQDLFRADAPQETSELSLTIDPATWVNSFKSAIVDRVAMEDTRGKSVPKNDDLLRKWHVLPDDEEDGKMGGMLKRLRTKVI